MLARTRKALSQKPRVCQELPADLCRECARMGLFDSFRGRPQQPERSGEGAAPPAVELLSDSPASTFAGAQVLGNDEVHSIPGLAFPEVWSALATLL